MSDALLDRVLPLDDREPGYLQLYDASRLKRADGVSVMYCLRGANPNRRWQECEKIPGTDVFREGIVTSRELLKSNDGGGAPAKPGGSAATPAGPEK